MGAQVAWAKACSSLPLLLSPAPSLLLLLRQAFKLGLCSGHSAVIAQVGYTGVVGSVVLTAAGDGASIAGSTQASTNLLSASAGGGVNAGTQSSTAYIYILGVDCGLAFGTRSLACGVGMGGSVVTLPSWASPASRARPGAQKLLVILARMAVYDLHAAQRVVELLRAYLRESLEWADARLVTCGAGLSSTLSGSLK